MNPKLNGPLPPDLRGGVVLGKQPKREIRVYLNPRQLTQLQVLAQFNGITSESEAATAILGQALEIGMTQLIVSKLIAVLADWLLYVKLEPAAS